MRHARRRLIVVTLLAFAALSGCSRATEIQNRLAALGEPLAPVMRDAVWAHGDPYTWQSRRNVLIESTWNDYLHGREPMVNHRLYAIDLTSRRMRIEDRTTQTVSLYDGNRWRVFIQGQEIQKPAELTEETAPYMAMLEYAACEMRVVRLLFCLPYSLLEDGVSLRSLGRIESPGGGNVWDVVEATFDYQKTGFLPTDRLMVYFDERSDRVFQVFLRMSGEPFYSMPFWGEWADYRRQDDGLLVARRWEFRRTDEQGQADKGRRLSMVHNKVAFNQDLPAGLFDKPTVAMPPVPDAPVAPPAKRIGEDVIDPRAAAPQP